MRRRTVGVVADADASDPLALRLLGKRRVDPDSGCWEWQERRDRWGYGRITVDHRRYSVHRLAASVFLGFNLDSDLHVLHRCDNPYCFRPDHFFFGTNADNVSDRQSKLARTRITSM